MAMALAGICRTGDAFDLTKQVSEFTLPNGMKWLVVRRTQAPVFSGIVMVRAGGADEVKGKTGIAHMFEHMAFKGSSRLGTRDWAKEKPILDEIEKAGDELTKLAAGGNKEEAAALAKKLAELTREADKYEIKNEVWEVMMRNGANDLNAYTSKDLTAFHASMAVTRLNLWARVIAEMIFEPAYREFYTERSVVAEERRSSVENSPEGALIEKVASSAFSDGPYSFSTIGFEKDILGLTISDARAFHDRNYVPSNMTGVIVGDVTPAQVKAVMMQAFGRYPAKPRPEGPKSGGTSGGGAVTKLKFDASSSVAMAFHKPTLPDKVEYAFDVITEILCDGRSSRLEKKLIYEEKIAKDVYCTESYPGSRLDDLFLVWIDPLKGVALSRIEKAVEDELARLGEQPVSDDELKRVRKQVLAGLMYSLDNNEDLAEALARFQTIFGDWKILAHYPEQIDKVDADEVMRVAGKYFTKDNRVIVERTK